MSARDTTKDLYRRLHHRFSGSGLILLEGVGNGAGYGNSGWSDAIAMSTWPSKGLTVYGFEIKATRQDWLHELDKPDKNAEWQGACDEWYIVAPKGIVKLDELPSEWGLMFPKGKDGLRIAVRSEVEGKRRTPRALLAAVFRAAGNERLRSNQESARGAHEQLEKEYQDRLDRQAQEVTEANRKYHELSGLLGGSWKDMDELRAKANVIRDWDPSSVRPRMDHLILSLERAAARLRKASAALVVTNGKHRERL